MLTLNVTSNNLAQATSVTPYATHPLQLPSSDTKVAYPTVSQKLIQAGLFLRNFALM